MHLGSITSKMIAHRPIGNIGFLFCHAAGSWQNQITHILDCQSYVGFDIAHKSSVRAARPSNLVFYQKSKKET